MKSTLCPFLTLPFRFRADRQAVGNRLLMLLLVILLLLTIVTINATAQQSYTLSSQTSGVYKARDYVRLLPGFRSSAAGIGNFQAAIDRQIVINANYLTADQTATLRQSTPNPHVGSTTGSFNVSATGGATYTVPIAVPPGPGGLQPSLSIAYNSQSGNGLLGIGMNLTGISAITRTMSTVYFDGTAKPIQANAYDNYALDGARLILVSGSNGTANAEYRTESENFAKATVKDANGYGARWFEVTTKEGIIYRYGSAGGRFSDPSNNDMTLAWYLDYVQDANGNYMQYSYRTDNNVMYLDNISYGGNVNTGASCNMTVQMIYDSRTDITDTHYISRLSLNGSTYNLKGKANFLLSKILVLNNGSTIRQYEANYSNGLFTRLVAIREKGQNGEQYYPTIFNWNPQRSVSDVSSIPIGLTPSNINGDVFFLSADLNGDGVADLVSLKSDVVNNQSVKSVCMHLSNCSGGQTTYTIPYYMYLPRLWNDGDIKTCTGTPLAGNIDGNGKDAIVYPLYFKVNNDSYVNLFKITDDEGPCPPLWTQCHLSNGGDFPFLAVADFNKDGKDEVLLMEKNSNKLAFFNGSSWIQQTLPLSITPEQIVVSDFNGDGLPDICLLSKGQVVNIPDPNWADDDARTGQKHYITVNCQGGYQILLNGGANNDNKYFTVDHIVDCQHNDYGFMDDNLNADQLVRIGDFNGDGFPDFIINQKGTSHWYLALNNGDGTFITQSISNIGLSDYSGTSLDDDKFNCYVLDFDGDGKSDIVVTNADYFWKGAWLGMSGYWKFKQFNTKWFRSNGNGFDLVKSTSVDQDNTWNNLITQGDFDGDGHQELFARGYDMSNGNGTCDNRIYKNPDYALNSGLLSQVTNGLGATTGINYKSLADKTVYAKGIGSSAPLFDIALAIPAVSQATVSGNATATSRYSYAGGWAHLLKGFLGFKTTTATQVEQSVTSQTTTELNTAWYVPSTVTSKTSYSDGATASSTSSFNYTDLGNKRYLQVPATKTDQDIYGNPVNTNYSYDGNGNLLNEKSTYATGMYKQTSYDNYTAAGSYLPNKPQLITTTWKHADDGNEFITKTALVYDATHGYITQKTENAQITDKQVTTTYGNFDGWGNPRTVTVAPAGLAASSETFEYDATGRFATRHTTPLGYVTVTYNPWGQFLTSTDDLSRTTTNSYDGLGRLTATTHPDGRISTQTLGWGSDINQCYYSLSQSSGDPWTKTWYDNIGRETKTESVGMKGISVTNTKGYNAQGRLASVDHRGDYTSVDTYVYDAQGRVTSNWNCFGGVTTFNYANRKISTTLDNRTTTKTMDAWGNTVTVADPDGNTVSYAYYSCGKPHTVAVAGAQWSMAYDAVGNQTQLIDPNAGTCSYSYNALGQIKTQTTPKNTTVMDYDAYDRVQNRTRNGSELTTYAYVPSGDGKGQVSSVTGPNGNKISYGYDHYDRLTSETRLIDGENFTFGYGYDGNGNLTATTYPTGYAVSRAYDGYGFTDKVTAGGATLWQQGNYTGTSSNGTLAGGAMNTYTQRLSDGRLQLLNSQRGSTNLRNLVYDFNATTGNLNSRNNTVSGISDSFGYDKLDRLTAVTGTNPQNITYDPNGNITGKSGVGSYTYDNGRPHAVSKVSNDAGVISATPQTVDYTSFDKVLAINEDPVTLSVSYTPDDERAKTVLSKLSVMQKTTIFDGDFEHETFTNGTTRQLHYIALGDGVFAIMVRNAGIDSMYYVHPDHLGSYTLVTDAQGNVKQRAEYDPWGLRKITEGSLVFARGFTGHEHLDAFGLINMNGRCYDPVIGRFLSPDPYIQAPGFSQGFNRYSYCVNNPLKYSDPSGELFGIDDAIVFAVLSSAMMSGAQAHMNGGSFWKGAAQGAVIGAASAAIPFGIGTAFGHGLGGVGTELLRAGAHGLGNGLLNVMQGGSFGNGFATGAVASLAGSAGKAMGFGSLGVVGTCTVAGAGASALTGGNWMSGAMAGMSIGMFNHEGEKLLLANGTYATASFDDVVCTAKMPAYLKAHYLLDYAEGAYITSSALMVTFSKGAYHLVNTRLSTYMNRAFTQAALDGIKSVNISCTTDHPSNNSRSAHTVKNGARALDINIINGTHVSPQNSYANVFQNVIKTTPGYLENYGPFIVNKISNGSEINAPWARLIPGGHYDHIHISVPW